MHAILQIHRSAEGTENHIFENKCPLNFGTLLQEKAEQCTEDQNASDATRAKDVITQKTHSITDRNFKINEDVLSTMLAARKGDEYYEKISSIIEEASI